jgi:RHS repeat-associated protein
MAVREGLSSYTIPNDKLYQSKKLHSTILNAANDELNIYDFNARQYDPVIGRFTSLDPMEQFFSGCVGIGNDWANLVDPTGMIAEGPRGLLPVSGHGYWASGQEWLITSYPVGVTKPLLDVDYMSVISSWGLDIGSSSEWGPSSSSATPGGFSDGSSSGVHGGPSGGGPSGGGGSSISNPSNYGESPEDRFKREQDQIKSFNGRQNANQQARDEGNATAASSPLHVQQQIAANSLVNASSFEHGPNAMMHDNQTMSPNNQEIENVVDVEGGPFVVVWAADALLAAALAIGVSTVIVNYSNSNPLPAVNNSVFNSTDATFNSPPTIVLPTNTAQTLTPAQVTTIGAAVAKGLHTLSLTEQQKIAQQVANQSLKKHTTSKSKAKWDDHSVVRPGGRAGDFRNNKRSPKNKSLSQK